MEEMIQIEKWKLEKIEDAMRININAHSMKNKECCAHRQMMKAYAWVVQALEVVSSVPQANELLPHVSKPKGTVCPVCENPYPYLLTNGAYECEECGCNWRAN